mgnify:CR=1 FL=1
MKIIKQCKFVVLELKLTISYYDKQCLESYDNFHSVNWAIERGRWSDTLCVRMIAFFVLELKPCILYFDLQYFK